MIKFDSNLLINCLLNSGISPKNIKQFIKDFQCIENNVTHVKSLLSGKSVSLDPNFRLFEESLSRQASSTLMSNTEQETIATSLSTQSVKLLDIKTQQQVIEQSASKGFHFKITEIPESMDQITISKLYNIIN